ncbi:MAG: DUF86 domain-containing protein [Deltaproteobacteria bacterium]|nr:DUF86 domain-containing protein [Deltaproteobacteria bacterium]
MYNRDLVLRKIESLKRYLDELSTFRTLTFEEYKGKISNYRSVERLIQLLVEVASDINAHLLARMRGIAVEDYRSSFLRMGETGLLDPALAQDLSRATGMRNRLVHDYEKIDDRTVFNTIPLALAGFKEYIRQILNLL